jgi:hypothetical protein
MKILATPMPASKCLVVGGPKFLASTIAFLSKAKDKNEKTKEVTGNVITVVLNKSRFSKPFRQIKISLDYDTGIDRYSGLLEIALESGVFQQVGKNPKTYVAPGFFEEEVETKELEARPQEYYTKEVLTKINEWVKQTIALGKGEIHNDNDFTDGVE